MLLRFSNLKTNPFRTEAAIFFIVPIKSSLNELRDEEVTTSSGRLFHFGTTLFKKKLCLTVTDWEQSFLSLDLKDSLRILNELPPTPDVGLNRPSLC